MTKRGFISGAVNELTNQFEIKRSKEIWSVGVVADSGQYIFLSALEVPPGGVKKNRINRKFPTIQ